MLNELIDSKHIDHLSKKITTIPIVFSLKQPQIRESSNGAQNVPLSEVYLVVSS